MPKKVSKKEEKIYIVAQQNVIEIRIIFLYDSSD